MLRALLLFPLGALVISLFRNVIGFETFGTFMPILIAFALRSTSLGVGLLMVGTVIVVGILGRLVLEPSELEASIIMGIVGAPFFIYLARRRSLPS